MKEQTNLTLHKNILPFLNISLYLNNIKLIQSLTIENTSGTDIASVEVKITADLPCIEPFSYIVPFVPAGKDVKIPLDAFKLNRDFFGKLSETEKANIRIEIIEQDAVIVSESAAISIHPLEHFGGFQVLPELIAAYVTPNHSYVYHVKRKAVEILEKQGLKAAFEGYQSNDPERVLQIMSAIYSAIQSEEIVYSSLPPGYEETGQRLRLLNTIRQEKFGNCIDLSLLFAACLEAADLNPVLIIVRGHAFVGCWLNDDTFPETVNDDKAAITKRLSKGIKEMAAVEATSVCKGNNIRFSDALNMGEAQLVQKEDFLISIDLKRARKMRIRPLPLLGDVPGVQLDGEVAQKTEAVVMEKRFDIGTIYQDDLLQSQKPKTRQKVWERKLLDLSLRNSLLNLRMTRNMLQLVDIDISHLEDTLSEGKSFSIMPDPRAEILRRYNLFTQPLHHSSPLYQMANEELKYNRLLTHYHQQDLDSILTYINKNAKQAIEENGSSTLYLAVGLLKWYDRKTPDQARYSPILLLPVELSRRSVNSKFMLKSREEETLINITLIEFLRQEYELNLSALEQLPYDDKGMDVAKVMGTLRRAVMQLKGWDVEEQLVLGNFSFSKLILWKDIVIHQDELLKSTMVRSLAEGRSAFDGGPEAPAETDFDSIESASLTLPIPADVSQMDAVHTSQKGQSFILHGPPGTGKSQTITNIIADALYRGKRVLFVAAKKAALDVVHKRLEQIGLAPFSLELHSNKSKKSEVLERLSRTIGSARPGSSGDFAKESQRLDAAKKAISTYVNVLHRKQPVGWSLYDSITALQNYGHENYVISTIPETVLNQLNATLWRQWTDWLPQFQSIAQVILHPKENPLSAFRLSTYSPTLHEAIAAGTQELLQVLPALQQQTQALAAAIHFPFSLQTREESEQFVHATVALKDLPDMPLELCLYLSGKENHSVYEEWSRHFQQYQSVLQGLLNEYNRSILVMDLSATEMQWKQARQSWFLPKWLRQRKIRKQLGNYRNTAFRDNTEVEQLFARNNQLKEVQRLLQQTRFADLQKALKNLYRDEQTDIPGIALKASQMQRLSSAMTLWGGGAAGKWMQVLLDKNFRSSGEITNGYSNLSGHFIREWNAYAENEKDYQDITGIQFHTEGNWPGSRIAQLQDIQTHLPTLKNWMNYTQVRNAGKELQLQWLTDAYEQRLCEAGHLSGYFSYTTHASIVRSLISQHESLSLFDPALFQSKIEQYKKIANEFRDLTIEELRARLASQLPGTKAAAMSSSEVGILQRAIKNRGRGLSIRKLFDQIPTLLPRIAPCMLMSPISAAQYFDVNDAHFDLVIFDEASQLPTCEAISALARAKQAIIVGDPRQMPPTSFFSTNKVDEENMEVEDLESILDDCLSLSVPSKYLLRHYRSRHESLIAFSNVNYYESKLLTFPSADDLSRKVRYHHVPGFYDKGKTRTNKSEADAIVEYIKAHYCDPLKSKLSLGVVTFSQTQQNLVEDKLQELFAANPQLEALAGECAEPLFVKNLENVQGDERDIILFSICYAPDEEGKMSMNFGPLNRDGGWRRLNVAVTRARCEMHVFATLQADRIDLGRTSAEGVAGLKAFLQFAENGHLAVRPEDVQARQDRRHLSEVIAKRLQEKGLSVKRNIGTSGFKVDIGIIHPGEPQQYILGIVLDGYYYYNARTANDREMVMPSVLKALGWNIHRVWTMDWYENAATIIDAIAEKVKQLQAQPKADPEPEATAESVGTFDPEPANAVVEVPPVITVTRQKPYVAHMLAAVPNATGEMVFDPANRMLLVRQIREVVNTEAPIGRDLLYRKVLQAWNISRTGAKLFRHLEGVMKELNFVQTLHHQPFYHRADSDGTLAHYRSNDTEKRAIEDIAPEEIVVALHEAVENSLSIEEDELLRHLARTFGFAKVGKQMDTLLRYAVDLAEKRGKVKREGVRVKVG